VCGEYCKTRCTKHEFSSRKRKTWTTDLDDLKHCIRIWVGSIMPSLELLCIGGIVVSQGASRPAVVISSTVFDLDIVFSNNYDLSYCRCSNTGMQIARLVWFNCSCLVMTLRFAMGPTWPLSNLQGKVAILIRWGCVSSFALRYPCKKNYNYIFCQSYDQSNCRSLPNMEHGIFEWRHNYVMIIM